MPLNETCPCIEFWGRQEQWIIYKHYGDAPLCPCRAFGWVTFDTYFAAEQAFEDRKKFWLLWAELTQREYDWEMEPLRRSRRVAGISPEWKGLRY